MYFQILFHPYMRRQIKRNSSPSLIFSRNEDIIFAMRFIVASDIHANLPALEAFYGLLDSRGLSDTPVYFLGDYVNLGAFPDETVSLLRSKKAALFLMGNHDRYIVNLQSLMHNPYIDDQEGIRHCVWTKECLSAENLDWLTNLKAEYSFEAEGWTVNLIHGRYGSDEETIDDTKLPSFQGKTIFICGHTHVPRDTGGKTAAGRYRVLNPGSLGKPLDGDNRGAFGIVDIPSGTKDNPGEPDFEIVRFEYDIEKNVAALKKQQVPWRNGIINSLRSAVYTNGNPEKR